MIRLKRLVSAAIDITPVFLAIFLAEFMIGMTPNHKGYTIAFLLILLILGVEINLKIQKNKNVEKSPVDLESLTKREKSMFFFPFWLGSGSFMGRSMGMKFMGLYVSKADYEINYRDMDQWRKAAMWHSVLTFGVFFLTMFFDKYGRTFYDLKLDVVVVDEETFKQLRSQKDIENDIANRPPIIKNDIAKRPSIIKKDEK